MSTPILAISTLVLAAFTFLLWTRWRKAVRAEYIRRYTLPAGLYEKLRKKRPSLSLKDCQLVGHALRQFFLTYLKSGYKHVSMPSQAADDLWHELILYTRHYEQFCDRAFGRFLHHTPAVVLSSAHENNAGLRRCWWHACLEENINPKKPTRLPLLFAIDAKLNIPDGFRYATDCRGVKRSDRADSGSATYCASDFSNSSFDGTTDGFGDASSGSSDAGDGGGGCGGGCGGD